MNVLQPCLQLCQERNYSLLAYGRLDENCASVLCRTGNMLHPYVTWIYTTFSGMNHGHYFASLEEAQRDFTVRYHPNVSRLKEVA